MFHIFNAKIVKTVLSLALCSKFIACHSWEINSDGGASNVGGFDAQQTTTSSAEVSSTSSSCNQGGAGGGIVGSGGAGGDDTSENGPWGNSCDWCNGPGCEELDRPCQDIESGSRGVTCFDKSDTLGSEDHCFPALDTYHWNRPVLCCCEPGDCPGV